MPVSSTPPAGDPNAPKNTDNTPKTNGGKEVGYQDSDNKSHTFLNMTFTPKQWHQLTELMIQSLGKSMDKERDHAVKAIKNFNKDPEEQV
jgi:hypothetical protein